LKWFCKKQRKERKSKVTILYQLTSNKFIKMGDLLRDYSQWETIKKASNKLASREGVKQI
tara:strand:- start:44 stop:223 length:180 start_codon:yes stop_codon:yes gene_type:complete